MFAYSFICQGSPEYGTIGVIAENFNQAMESLLSFLSAGTDSDENWPDNVNKWRHQFSDEISFAEMEFMENALIEE